jgi:hypothetical protein
VAALVLILMLGKLDAPQLKCDAFRPPARASCC